MSTKTKQIITTVIGAVVVAAGSIVAALKPEIAPGFVAISGAANELINIILQQFVKE